MSNFWGAYQQFDIVQNIMQHDTRVQTGKKEPYLFSGFIECADCHSPMVRRTASGNGKQYIYYMCSTNKLSLGCSSHRVNEKALYTSVLETISTYCNNVADLYDKLSEMSFETVRERQLERIEKAEKAANSEISDLKRTISVVQNRYTRNLETKEVCDEICRDIQSEINALKKKLDRLQTEKTESIQEYRRNTIWIKLFSKYGDISELNRSMLAYLIDRIYIYEGKRIVIRFKYQDKYEQLLQLINTTVKEAV